MRRSIFLLVAMFIGLQAFAQTTISGTVKDSNGEPVPGANVRVKGYSDVGTITDLNGAYSLNVPAEATTLVVSFVGMKTTEVEIGGQTSIDITLENEDVGIDEVVVTALGITRDKKSLGYATQTVDGGDITEAPDANLVNSLSGRVNVSRRSFIACWSSGVNLRQTPPSASLPRCGLPRKSNRNSIVANDDNYALAA
jgi:hypothetical protein